MVSYYAVDDGEFAVYEGGIELSEGDHTVQFYAMDEELKLEDVKEATVKVDFTPPTIAVIADQVDGLNGYYRSSVVNVSLEAVDLVSGVDTLYYQIDDGEEQIYTEALTVEEDGEHLVRYYAKDQAGNLESVTEVSHVVKSPEEINWVENVGLTEFHNALTLVQEFEVDRKVQVGDQIYLDESYLFEELPEYLEGSRLIRTKRHANKTGDHDYYLRFDTTVPVKVYVVVENTVAELAGFTLIGQTKFASQKHFSQMQNVFMREVSGTTTMRIQGSKLLDLGHAPLVFVDYDDSWTQTYASIETVIPVKEAGIWYLDLAGYGYDRTDGMLENENLSWSYLLNGVEVTLAHGETARLPITFRDQAYQLEIRLVATNSLGVTGMASTDLVIVDQSGVVILQPQGQDKFLPGETITLVGELRDEMGGLLSSPIHWQLRREGQRWQSIGNGNSLEYILPQEQGAYYVKAYAGDQEMVVKFEVTQTKKKPGKGKGK